MSKDDLPTLAAACALSVFAASEARPAALFHDEASGLQISPPPGYELKRLPAQGMNAVRVSLKRPEDRDTGCQVGFARAPQNEGYSQAEINARMRTREHQDLARASIAPIYDARAVTPFDSGDVTGLAIVADIKPREGLAPRALDIQNLMILLETPKGRTSVVCVAERSDFARRRGEFEALARSVTPPR